MKTSQYARATVIIAVVPVVLAITLREESLHYVGFVVGVSAIIVAFGWTWRGSNSNQLISSRAGRCSTGVGGPDDLAVARQGGGGFPRGPKA